VGKVRVIEIEMDSSNNFTEIGNLNTARCPLCGELNHCAMAADPSATKCWCEEVKFPDELLDQIHENAVRKTCVCKKCLEIYQESIDSTDAI
jgi:hypothetical protein